LLCGPGSTPDPRAGGHLPSFPRRLRPEARGAGSSPASVIGREQSQCLLERGVAGVPGDVPATSYRQRAGARGASPPAPPSAVCARNGEIESAPAGSARRSEILLLQRGRKKNPAPSGLGDRPGAVSIAAGCAARDGGEREGVFRYGRGCPPVSGCPLINACFPAPKRGSVRRLATRGRAAVGRVTGLSG